jgi:hypothetical protein
MTMQEVCDRFADRVGRVMQQHKHATSALRAILLAKCFPTNLIFDFAKTD